MSQSSPCPNLQGVAELLLPDSPGHHTPHLGTCASVLTRKAMPRRAFAQVLILAVLPAWV